MFERTNDPRELQGNFLVSAVMFGAQPSGWWNLGAPFTFAWHVKLEKKIRFQNIYPDKGFRAMQGDLQVKTFQGSDGQAWFQPTWMGPTRWFVQIIGPLQLFRGVPRRKDVLGKGFSAMHQFSWIANDTGELRASLGFWTNMVGLNHHGWREKNHKNWWKPSGSIPFA